MKRKISIFLVATLIVFVLTACGSGAGKAEEKKEEPKPEVSEEVEDSESEAEEQERPEEVAEADEGTESEESAEGTDEAGDPTDQEAALSEETEGDSTEGEVKDGTTPITDEQINELKSYIKDAVISEYLEPNGLTAADLEWPEDWSEFIAAQESIGLSLSIGMPDEIVVNSSIDAVLKGVQNWFLNQGNFDYSYSQMVMHKLRPFYETIPAIDYSAE